MSTIHTEPRPRRLWALGGIGFAAIFLCGQFASTPLRNGDIPMPDASTSEIVDFFAANAASSITLGVSHLLAAVSLLFLVGFAALDLRPGPAGRIGVVSGWVAGLALAVSGALSITLAIVAPSAAPDTVATLRDFNFWSGGVLHTVALGLFAGLWCLNSPTMGRVLRGFGKVLAVPAVLSVTSLLWFYASALLPLGRYTLMIWFVFAAVSLLRANRAGQNVS